MTAPKFTKQATDVLLIATAALWFWVITAAWTLNGPPFGTRHSHP